jgi:hypothetical protein
MAICCFALDHTAYRTVQGRDGDIMAPGQYEHQVLQKALLRYSWPRLHAYVDSGIRAMIGQQLSLWLRVVSSMLRRMPVTKKPGLPEHQPGKVDGSVVGRSGLGWRMR